MAQFADYMSEQRVIHGNEVRGPDATHCWESLPLGREDTDPVMWLAMQFVQINSAPREKSRLLRFDRKLIAENVFPMNHHKSLFLFAYS